MSPLDGAALDDGPLFPNTSQAADKWFRQRPGHVAPLSSVPALTQGNSFRVSWRRSERAPLGEMGSHGKLSFFQPFCSRRSGGPAWTPGPSSGGLCRTEGVLQICRFWSCQGHRGEALSCCCGHIWAKSPPFPFHSPASLSCSVKVSVPDGTLAPRV